MNQLVNFIDFKEIYKKVKKNQLKYFPTFDIFNQYLQHEYDKNIDSKYTQELYNFITNENINIDIFESDSDDFIDDIILSKYLKDGILSFELYLSGDDNNESNNHNIWCYGFTFDVDLTNLIFLNFIKTNYS